MHVLNKFKIGRRQVLRGISGGAAVSVGLPILEAMLNAHGDALAGGAELPKRFISWMFGNGVQLDRFEPATVGSNWELSEQLAPLADVKDYVTLCTGMQNRFGGNAITHHEGMSVFSGYDFVPRDDLGGIGSDWGGPTIDQVIADAIAQEVVTPVRSLQIGGTKFDSPVDVGSTAKAISARGEPGSLTVLFPEHNPRTVWNTLFGEFSAPKDDREMRLGVLDAVREDTAALRAQLGSVDRQRLDAHLDHVAELEAKIAAAAPVCSFPDEPTYEMDEANGAEQTSLANQLMSELIAYAFSCDITRVASNMFTSVAAEVDFGELPGSHSQHVASHDGGEIYHEGIVFLMSRFADLLTTLRDTVDVTGGNLLDSTLVFASTEISQGWSHSWQRQPMIIGGHGRGYLAHPGIHYQAIAPAFAGDDGTSEGNVTDVLLALAQCYAPEINSIGAGPQQSTSPLTQILA